MQNRHREEQQGKVETSKIEGSLLCCRQGSPLLSLHVARSPTPAVVVARKKHLKVKQLLIVRLFIFPIQ